MSGLGAFSRSKARRVEGGETRITFTDVAGIDEAKAELTEIVDFLKNPERYQKLGGRIPRGVLLSGQPGTGKTLLAKAVAGEAGVPFFSISASEFVEAIVGIGASRVRDLFKTAKESSPAIIFIDELDAIGRSRSQGVGFGGGNDEREQTLNQILTEMDGFESNVAVIVLGATNRPEILDQALLRPGRFDRRVVVPPPDKEGRRKILEVHTRSLPLADDVHLDRIASTTPGMVGADLANLANEAALTAARRNHEKVEFADFTDALEKIVLGAPRGTVLSDQDRRRVAYHEAGHAIVGMLTPGADPVRKVSIIPRGMALGVTLSAPDLDKANYEEGYLLTKIKVALGGRVAEEIVYGTITTGAESDIEQLTGIARAMVGRWGMSRVLGPIAVLPSEARGPMLPGAAEVSQETQRLIDQEVQRIVEENHAQVTALLTEHRDKLESLVAALLEQETVDQDAAYAAAQVDPASMRAPERRADRRGEHRSAHGAPALNAGVAGLEPRAHRVEQLALLVDVVAPRAGRRVAEQPLRLGDREAGGVGAGEGLADLDRVAVVVADQVGERPVGVVVGRGDVEDLVGVEVGLRGEPERVGEVVGVDVGPEVLARRCSRDRAGRGRGCARSCPPTAPSRDGSSGSGCRSGAWRRPSAARRSAWRSRRGPAAGSGGPRRPARTRRPSRARGRRSRGRSRSRR